MKKFAIALLVGSMFVTPLLASAQPYVSASAGLGLISNSELSGIKDFVEYNAGIALNGAAGYDFGNYRVEGAVGYQSNPINAIIGTKLETLNAKADYSMLSFMANGYVDFQVKDAGIEPYVMGGIGFANTDYKATKGVDTEKQDNSSFAWQIGTGVGVQVAKNLTLDVGYRYFALTNMTFKAGSNPTADMSLATHNIMAGIRYSL
jgi:opacity protein-like surface antigen